MHVTLLQMLTHFQMEDQLEGVDSYMKTHLLPPLFCQNQPSIPENSFEQLLVQLENLAEEIEVCTVYIILFGMML